MKKLLSFVGILFFSTLLLSAQSVLTNESIIEMKKAGLSDDLILTKITSETGNYDTSTEAILNLKEQGFSDGIIGAMISENSAQQEEMEFNGMFPSSIEEVDGKLLINKKYTIEKGGELQVYLPFAGKDFVSITPQAKSKAKLIGKIAGAVATGAAAVGVGSGNLGVMSGALDVMSKAHAVEWGADALQQIQDLPISDNAKKIAGSKMKVLSWKYTEEGYILTTELDKKKYNVALSDAIMMGEVKL